jgi:raffinose/stachyose/melibiose transport system permease protein
MQKLYSNKLVIFLLILPAVALFVFAVLAPICLSVYYGMTDYTGMGKPNFVGLENFTKLLFHDEIFWRSLLNALLLGAGFVFIQHPVCMLFAILLDKVSGKWESFFRAAYFIPNVISVVVIASMWVYIFNPDFGLINTILGKLGLPGLMQEWLGNPDLALWSVLFVLMWHGFGWGVLIYYAGLKGIDTQLYEAAAIDGATEFQTYMKITMPLMKPVIRVNVTLAIISALKQMETVYLLTNGGPGNRTQFLANYLYIKAFSSGEYGYGNAISVVFVIICLLATVGLTALFKEREKKNPRRSYVFCRGQFRRQKARAGIPDHIHVDRSDR